MTSQLNKKIRTATLGFPRIGADRELKKAVEGYWKGKLTITELKQVAADIKAANWEAQKNISYIPSNDFSFYDHILDSIVLFGAVPERFKDVKFKDPLDLTFAMARGITSDKGEGCTALEMTKWFDTNYHYLVAEFSPDQEFKISSKKIIQDYLDAKNLGYETRPVLIGPVSFLLLGKMTDGSNNQLKLLNKLLPVYEELFSLLKKAGVKDIQIDEPFLVTDLNSETEGAYISSYRQLTKFAGSLKLHLTSYFADLAPNINLAISLECDSIHLDLVRGPAVQLDTALNSLKPNQSLSLGLVDGRNIWINDLEKSITLAKQAIDKLGSERVIIASSCQLLHVPVDLNNETKLDAELKSWLAFAKQKIAEITVIAKAAAGFEDEVKKQLAQNSLALKARKTSKRIHSPKVKERLVSAEMANLGRKNAYPVRKKVQSAHIVLPIFPTTTIGSFPQIQEIRKIRADFKATKISEGDYKGFIKNETAKAIKFQEEIGIDVLVHGEFERNDMVEYFGEQLSGFAFTENGWVQSYGSRCVKPPIIFGDVSRPEPMTVEWFAYAQSLTNKPVKGMLTGPITILQWSFVRNDQPRKDTALQIAFAIRDEVVDLEKAGAKIIQIDEAALREGLPIKKGDRTEYLRWAIEAFKVTAGGVRDSTQIHTHMCYSEFNDIIESVANMDADVISIETSRSKMELLDAFTRFKYPNEIGPGVYDIHSPRIPTKDEIEQLLKKALKVLKVEQLWINPDCGLKTRGWDETKVALKNMVEVASELRASF